MPTEHTENTETSTHRAPLTFQEAQSICQQFAQKHKIIFDEEGECGFMRECVGFRQGDHWIDHNPCNSSTYERIEALDCYQARPPTDVDYYHKHDCLAVLGRGEEAVIGLAKWVQKMEAAGTVEIVRYETGAIGLQAVLSGVFRYAVTVR